MKKREQQREQVPGPRLVMYAMSFNGALHTIPEDKPDTQRNASLIFECGPMVADIRLPVSYLEKVAQTILEISAEAQKGESGIILPTQKQILNGDAASAAAMQAQMRAMRKRPE